MSKWEIENKIIKECGYIDNITTSEDVEIILSFKVQAAIKYLCEHIEVEWQMFLTGKTYEDGSVYCEDFIIPKQKVTAASVESLEIVDKEYVKKHDIVANIHSHGTMGVFFSPTDDTANNFIPINIVTNNKEEYKAVSHYELPCGCSINKKAKVLYEVRIATEEEMEDVKNIEIVKYTHVTKWRGKNDNKREDKELFSIEDSEPTKFDNTSFGNLFDKDGNYIGDEPDYWPDDFTGNPHFTGI